MEHGYAPQWVELKRRELALQEDRWRLVQDAVRDGGGVRQGAELLGIPASVAERYIDWGDFVAAVVHQADRHQSRRGWWTDTGHGDLSAEQHREDAEFDIAAAKQPNLRAIVYVAHQQVVRIRAVEYWRPFLRGTAAGPGRQHEIPLTPPLTPDQVEELFPTLPLRVGDTYVDGRINSAYPDYLYFPRPGAAPTGTDTAKDGRSGPRKKHVRIDLPPVARQVGNSTPSSTQNARDPWEDVIW